MNVAGNVIVTRRYMPIVCALFFALSSCTQVFTSKESQAAIAADSAVAPVHFVSDGKMVIANGTTTVSGTNDYEFQLIGAGKYIIRMKEKSYGNIKNFQFWSKPGNQWLMWAAATGTSNVLTGYCETADIITVSQDTTKGKITVTGEYIIEFMKLPKDTVAQALPKSFTGSGNCVFGPITLKPNTLFTVTCADAVNSAFAVQLFDANGNEVFNDNSQTLFSNIQNGSVVNNFQENITKKELAAGNYYINVDANGRSSYTVVVQ